MLGVARKLRVLCGQRAASLAWPEGCEIGVALPGAPPSLTFSISLPRYLSFPRARPQGCEFERLEGCEFGTAEGLRVWCGQRAASAALPEVCEFGTVLPGSPGITLSVWSAFIFCRTQSRIFYIHALLYNKCALWMRFG